MEHFVDSVYKFVVMHIARLCSSQALSDIHNTNHYVLHCDFGQNIRGGKRVINTIHRAYKNNYLLYIHKNIRRSLV